MSADLCIPVYKEILQVFQKYCVQNTREFNLIPTRNFNDVGIFYFLGLQISNNEWSDLALTSGSFDWSASFIDETNVQLWLHDGSLVYISGFSLHKGLSELFLAQIFLGLVTQDSEKYSIALR